MLLLGAAASGWGQFSHKQHLEWNLDCGSCHVGQELPTQRACAGCHAEAKPIKAPGKLRVDHFDHASHVKFGNIAPMLRAAVQAKTYLSAPPPHLDTRIACAGCHHGIEHSDNVAGAKLFPQMADCLVCHNKIDPPYSCEKCHDNPAALKPANHTSHFIDQHNRKDAGLDRTTCAVCHGKTFSCLGCH
jgi:hypothetical protein